MARRYQIRMGGYGPASTGFSRALKFIGDELAARFGDQVEIKYVWNIMDLGYRAEDILWLVEHGLLTLGYQSSSYLTDRVPELSVADLPFLFQDNAQARAAIDGAFGAMLTQKIEQRVDYRILGYFENGFRQISNRLRPVRRPADLAGMRIRVLPSRIQARTFELLGAVPLMWDLTEAIAAIKAGEIDAQENPFANTVTYGVHKFHRFHTVSNHFYISRPIFVHRPTFDAYPKEFREAFRQAAGEAVTFQRQLAVEEDETARRAVLEAGGEILPLDAEGHAAFVQAVQPIYAEARAQHAAALKIAGLG
ncbi:MAG TPA: TRAP transporter substrate-binding protein [Xanthobacteraceae bacterium]|nr:TRAP transporter substrate-binding protein [Xanthobacteraceae bacterium]